MCTLPMYGLGCRFLSVHFLVIGLQVPNSTLLCAWVEGDKVYTSYVWIGLEVTKCTLLSAWVEGDKVYTSFVWIGL